MTWLVLSIVATIEVVVLQFGRFVLVKHLKSKENKTTSSLFPLFIQNNQKFRIQGNSLMLQQYSSNEV